MDPKDVVFLSRNINKLPILIEHQNIFYQIQMHKNNWKMLFHSLQRNPLYFKCICTVQYSGVECFKCHFENVWLKSAILKLKCQYINLRFWVGDAASNDRANSIWPLPWCPSSSCTSSVTRSGSSSEFWWWLWSVSRNSDSDRLSIF